jgi:hypothetical protein
MTFTNLGEVVMKRVLLPAAMAVFVCVPSVAHGATSHTVDLATGRVDGHPVLGRTIAGVTAGLGRPDFRIVSPSRYRLGWGDRHNFAVEVIFRRRGGVQRAWSLAFERGNVRDVRAGALLARTPEALQTTLVASYGDTLRLVQSYHCKAGRCVGEFAPRPGHGLHLTFGSRPTLGTWMTLWQVSE